MMRKSYQRRFNRIVRKLNKNIANDNLWQGRFEMRQKDAWFLKFSDNSGGILTAVMRICDKKTGYYKDYHIDYAPYYHSNEWYLWEAMNKFITEDAKIWEEEPSPRVKEFIKDYKKVPICEAIMQMPFNFYKGREF